MSGDDAGLRILPAGDRALLVVPPAPAEQLSGLVDRLRGAGLSDVQDFLPAAETVLVVLQPGADAAAVERDLRRLAASAPAAADIGAETEEVTVPVRYDGADLDQVAGLLDVSVEEVVARHTDRVWRCRFIGFTAGFGYLESDGANLSVPRRAQSRTAVPAGAVALADGYSAVYPRRAPGGWQLIGSTELAMWDLARPRPALLTAGTRVRFVAVEGR